MTANEQHLKILRENLKRSTPGSKAYKKIQEEIERISVESGAKKLSKEQIMGRAYNQVFGTRTKVPFKKKSKAGTLVYDPSGPRQKVEDIGYKNATKHLKHGFRMSRGEGGGLNIDQAVEGKLPHATNSTIAFVRHNVKFHREPLSKSGFGSYRSYHMPGAGSQHLDDGRRIISGTINHAVGVNDKTLIAGAAGAAAVGAGTAYALSKPKVRKAIKKEAKKKAELNDPRTAEGRKRLAINTGTRMASLGLVAGGTALGARGVGGTNILQGMSFGLAAAHLSQQGRKFALSENRKGLKFKDTPEGRREAAKLGGKLASIPVGPAVAMSGVQAWQNRVRLSIYGSAVSSMIGSGIGGNVLVDKSKRIKAPKRSEIGSWSDKKIRAFAKQQATLAGEASPLADKAAVERNVANSLSKRRAKAGGKQHKPFYFRTVKGQRQRVKNTQKKPRKAGGLPSPYRATRALMGAERRVARAEKGKGRVVKPRSEWRDRDLLMDAYSGKHKYAVKSVKELKRRGHPEAKNFIEGQTTTAKKRPAAKRRKKRVRKGK